MVNVHLEDTAHSFILDNANLLVCKNLLMHNWVLKSLNRGLTEGMEDGITQFWSGQYNQVK